QALAGEIPQRLLEPADRAPEIHRAALGCEVVVGPVREVADLAGVAADEIATELPHVRDDRLVAVGLGVALAPAVETVRGLDLDEEPVLPRAGIDDERRDGRHLHEPTSLSWAQRRESLHYGLASPMSRGRIASKLWLPERHEDRDARLGAHLARHVALARQIFGDQDVARAEPSHGAVADLDVDRAGEREHRRAPRRMMPGVRSLRLEAADDDAAAGDQLRALGLVAPRLELRLDVLEVGLAVGPCVDPDDRHVSLLFIGAPVRTVVRTSDSRTTVSCREAQAAGVGRVRAAAEARRRPRPAPRRDRREGIAPAGRGGFRDVVP